MSNTRRCGSPWHGLCIKAAEGWYNKYLIRRHQMQIVKAGTDKLPAEVFGSECWYSCWVVHAELPICRLPVFDPAAYVLRSRRMKRP